MNCTNCGALIIDCTNTNGLCPRCDLSRLLGYFATKKPEAPVDQQQLDWQRMVDEGDRRMEDYE